MCACIGLHAFLEKFMGHFETDAGLLSAQTRVKKGSSWSFPNKM